MIALVFLISLISAALAVRVHKASVTDELLLDTPVLNAELVQAINSDKTSTWRASTEQNDFFKGATMRDAMRLMGVKPRTKAEAKAAKKGMTPKRALTAAEIAALPTNFDSRQHWPNCWTITQVRRNKTGQRKKKI